MVDQALVYYIRDAILKGYTKDEIKKILLENEWTEKEIAEGFEALSKLKAQETVKPEQPKTESQTKQEILTPIEKNRLVKFIKEALAKEITEEEIKSALKWKGWPEQKINAAFELIKKEEQPPQEKPVTIKEEKPEIKKPKIQIKTKITPATITSYILSFLLIAIVLGSTISLLFYVIAITNYEIVDPNTGQTVKGQCLEEKCADMKEFGMTKVKEKLTLTLILSSILALVIVLSYALVPFKAALLWITNLLYFMFITYIAYLWIRFNSTLGS
jgi:hypothetical protein